MRWKVCIFNAPLVEFCQRYVNAHNFPILQYHAHISTPAETTIVAFEVIIDQNSRPDRARESVKIPLDLEGGNAYFEVCFAYVWRHCDVILGQNTFFTLPRNSVVFIQKSLEQKLNTLETKFLYKIC